MAIKPQQLKYITPVIHILFWMLLFFLPYILRLTSTGVRMSDNMQFRLLLNNLVLIGFFYINAYFLYPKVYANKRLVIYAITLIASVFLLMKTTSFVEREFLPLKRSSVPDKQTEKVVEAKPKVQEAKKRNWDGKKGPFFYFSLFPYIFIIGISISYRIVRDSSRQEKIRKEKENETLKSELTFLRSQVSPHFMFNVLNTLVSMARKKSDLMEPSLIKLSNMMRYMLYESNDERITVEQEVQYLRSYIDLQLLRFGDDLDIRQNIQQDLDDYQIEPMLLIAFVENAFKHGVGMVEQPFIRIALAVDRSKHLLQFRVENSVSPVESAKDKSSGIGLTNMRRRLELLYKDRYTLETSENQGTFVAQLNIYLK
ncbi:sensor histidine kinase [Pedobacter sp. SYSU D00535]|uniref:sensor histidine kinase n=1 Tax=Pedobacter sp. SYSU D00535 TaxID=2810308 RepID=UPI001A956815|nr:histidine kinase [Pedobacter sp. SYSU D00535]